MIANQTDTAHTTEECCDCGRPTAVGTGMCPPCAGVWDAAAEDGWREADWLREKGDQDPA